MEKKRQPIGVFDSGAGGLSVLKELVRLMPEEDFIYILNGEGHVRKYNVPFFH